MIFIPRTNFVNIYFPAYCILIILILLIRQSFYRLNPFSANQSTVISRKRALDKVPFSISTVTLQYGEDDMNNLF